MSSELKTIDHGLKQIVVEGKILQEDLAIITSRIPSLKPILKEALNGTSAEDIRKSYKLID